MSGTRNGRKIPSSGWVSHFIFISISIYNMIIKLMIILKQKTKHSLWSIFLFIDKNLGVFFENRVLEKLTILILIFKLGGTKMKTKQIIKK